MFHFNKFHKFCSCEICRVKLFTICSISVNLWKPYVKDVLKNTHIDNRIQQIQDSKYIVQLLLLED